MASVSDVSETPSCQMAEWLFSGLVRVSLSHGTLGMKGSCFSSLPVLFTFLCRSASTNLETVCRR